MFSSIVNSFNKIFLFATIGLFFFLFDLYAWQAFKTISKEWSSRSKSILFYTYWVVSALFITTMVLRPYIQLEKFNSSFLMLFQVAGVMLFIAKFFAVLPLIAEDLFRAFEWLYSFFFKKSASDNLLHDRRKFISQTGLVAGAVPLMAMTYGLVRGAHNYKIKKITVSSAKLPPAFDGLRIVQLSDIHAGSFWDRDAVKRGVQMVKDLKADLVVFTGDLVNNTADEMDNWISVFSEINAPMGVFSVLGNHDYGDYVNWDSVQEKEANLERLKEVHKSLGWQLLLNQSHVFSKNGQELVLVGIENWSAKGNFPKYGELNNALESVTPDQFKILLSHDPSHWKAQVLAHQNHVDLTLSGHTHGFQFGIETHGFKWSPVKYMYPEWAGLYTQQNKFLYVNRGFGYIGYPGRLGINPEITLLTLKSNA